jgi:hypothetical protein
MVETKEALFLERGVWSGTGDGNSNVRTLDVSRLSVVSGGTALIFLLLACELRIETSDRRFPCL